MMKLKSKAKAIVEESIEREHEYLKSKDVGTEEYVESQKRLIALEGKLAELETMEIDSKDRFWKFVLEIAKIVTGLGASAAFFIVAIAQEREITFTGAARIFVNSIMPGGKKLF